MSEKVTIKAERRELHLPAIALRGLVVFPNNLVHFEVGREKSIAAVECRGQYRLHGGPLHCRQKAPP